MRETPLLVLSTLARSARTDSNDTRKALLEITGSENNLHKQISELRKAVEETTAAVRAMLETGILPPPVSDARCRNCSLIDLCQPEPLAARDKRRLLAATLFEPEPT